MVRMNKRRTEIQKMQTDIHHTILYRSDIRGLCVETSVGGCCLIVGLSDVCVSGVVETY